MHTTEFDEYAGAYDELVRDPIRDRFAANPDFFAQRKWLLLQSFLRRRKTNPAELNWLDVGCGTGTLMRMAGPSFKRTTGCDPSEKMLEACGDLDVRVQRPPTQLPFETDSFNLVTLVCVLHHVPPEDRPPLMAEVARVLRPGGVACVIEHNPWNPVTKLVVSRVPVDRDAILLTAGETRKLLRQAELSAIGCSYFLYFPEKLYRRLARLEALVEGLPLGGQYAMFAQA